MIEAPGMGAEGWSMMEAKHMGGSRRFGGWVMWPRPTWGHTALARYTSGSSSSVISHWLDGVCVLRLALGTIARSPVSVLGTFGH